MVSMSVVLPVSGRSTVHTTLTWCIALLVRRLTARLWPVWTDRSLGARSVGTATSVPRLALSLSMRRVATTPARSVM